MAFSAANAQDRMTPELLWKLGRVSGELVTDDGKSIIYGVTHYNIEQNKSNRNLYRIPTVGGSAHQLTVEEGSESVISEATGSGKITYLYKGQIWVMNSDGGAKFQVTHFDNLPTATNAAS